MMHLNNDTTNHEFLLHFLMAAAKFVGYKLLDRLHLVGFRVIDKLSEGAPMAGMFFGVRILC